VGESLKLGNAGVNSAPSELGQIKRIREPTKERGKRKGFSFSRGGAGEVKSEVIFGGAVTIRVWHSAQV